MRSTPRVQRAQSALPILLGFVSSCAVAVGACASGSGHQGAWGWAPVDDLGGRVGSVGGWLTLAGVVGLVLAWWLLRPSDDSPSRPVPMVRVLVCWVLPLLVAPPVLSADVFAYADIGWAVHVGADLNHTTLGGNGGPYAAVMDPFWVGLHLVYPPVSVWTAWAAAAVTGFDAYAGAIAQRAVAVLAVAVSAYLLDRLAIRLGLRRDRVLWWSLLNPLVVLHLVGGGHNDATMIALALAALLLARAGLHSPLVRWLLAPALAGLAVAAKPQAVVVLVPIAVWGLLHEAGQLETNARTTARTVALAALRVVAGAVVAVAVVAAACAATGSYDVWVGQVLRNGDSPSFGPVLLVSEAFSRTATALGTDASWAVSVAAVIVAAGAVAIACWLFVTRLHRPLEVAAWAGVLVALESRILAPWHLTLGIVLLGLVVLRPRTVTLTGCVLGGYVVAAASLTALGWSGPRLLVVLAVTGVAMWAAGRWAGVWRSPEARDQGDLGAVL